MSAAAAVLPVVWAFGHKLELEEPKGPVLVVPEEASEPEPVEESDPVPRRMAFYRKYTEAMLRRYVQMSLEAGRTPSLLGRELFRGKVTSYNVRSFEDVVIFVHDVGQCVAKLDSGQQYLIRRIALQEYTFPETAAMMGLVLKTVVRRYLRAIDDLTELFLERELLEPQKTCQEVNLGKSL